MVLVMLSKLNRFIFSVCSRTSISLIKYTSISDNLFNRYVYGSCGAVGFQSGSIFVSLSYVLILYLIVGDIDIGGGCIKRCFVGARGANLT